MELSMCQAPSATWWLAMGGAETEPTTWGWVGVNC